LIPVYKVEHLASRLFSYLLRDNLAPSMSEHSADGEPAPFRFLDLPVELRVMIYERMPFTTRRLTFSPPLSNPYWRPEVKSPVTIVMKFLETSILATCNSIRCEAFHIFKLKLQQLRVEPFRVIVGSSSFVLLSAFRSLFSPEVGPDYQHLPEDKARARDCANSMSWATADQLGESVIDDVRSFICDARKYFLRRSPTSSTVAILRDPDWDLRKHVRMLWVCLGFFDILPGAIGFTIRESELYDTGNTPGTIRPNTIPYPLSSGDQNWNFVPDPGEGWLSICQRLVTNNGGAFESHYEHIDERAWHLIWEEGGRDTRMKVLEN
jgi:hypothetical protein